MDEDPNSMAWRKLPPLSLGCSAFGGMFDIVPKEEDSPSSSSSSSGSAAGTGGTASVMSDSTCLQILRAALEGGVTLLDTGK